MRDILPNQFDRNLMESYLAGDCTGEDLVRAQRMIVAYPEAWRAISMFRDGLDGSADANVDVNVDNSLAKLRKSMDARVKVTPPVMRRTFGFFHYSGIAAIILLSVVAVHQIFDNSQIALFREQTARPGQLTRIKLADGSGIILAPGSTIRYAADFSTARREIFLEGEAYFDVQHDPANTFTVFAGNSSTQVLGTSFKVRKYANDDEVHIAVTSGKVAFSGAGTLSAGDVGILKSDGQAQVLHNQDTNEFIGWTEGHLTFTDMPLDDVLSDLSRWYDIQFVIESPTLHNERITIAFDRLSRDETLKDLAALLKAKYTVNGRIVRLTR